MAEAGLLSSDDSSYVQVSDGDDDDVDILSNAKQGKQALSACSRNSERNGVGPR